MDVGHSSRFPTLVSDLLLHPEMNHRAIGLEEINVMVLGDATVNFALVFVAGCEHCGEHAGLSFDYLLDAVTGCEASATEYFIGRLPKCPRCFAEITEKTFIVSH